MITAHTKTSHHIIKDGKGKPVAAIIPYDEYIARFESVKDDVIIPHEVVMLYSKSQHQSLIRAWREHLGITQAEMARRLAVSQSSYSQIEKSKTPRPDTLKKIAKVMKIKVEQLSI